ncbi:MAG: acetylxylan esterase [Bryobacterales bacterium]|nr:acetylxylan esterase [Bryobacterales bacterium]
MRVLLLFALALTAPAQPGEWDFLSDPSVFPDVHGMLPAYLKSRAFTMLDQRREIISRISTIADLEARRQRLRERIWSYLGGQPERTALNARVAGTLDRGDYTVEKIIFESRPHFYVTANLYLPKAGKAPYPAILFPLGHELGAKAHSAWQECLAGLARRGFAALAWDPIGQGERVQFYDEDWHGSKLQGSTVEHSILGMQSLLMGTHVAQYTIWDGIRALDYLLSRKEVDPKRVGCTGNSGGGTHTAYLSALDDRIQAAAPSCYITSWRRMLESIGPQDGEQVFPFFLRDGFDYPDYLYAFGGKPFLMLTAIRDFFPIGGARATFAEAKEVFGRLGLASQVAMFEADDGHGYSKPRREAAYRWFTRWLQGKENDSPEAPLTLASEEELQCTRTGQVKTSIPDAADVFTLNLETARRLRAGRTLSAEAIRARAREVTAYETHAGPLQITSYGHLTRPACRVEKLTLQSEPGILLPALLFLPKDGPERRPAILLANGKGKAAAAPDAEALAAKGYVVLAADLRGFGETEPALDRGDYFVRNFGDYESTWNALLIGKTMPGMRAGDVTRGIDLLAARKDVDSARIFVIGRGSAATAALLAALFDGRIRSLLVEGMLSSYDSVVTERILQRNVDQMAPSALRYFDLPAVAAALAPRRVGVFNGVNPLGQELTLSRLKKEYAGLPATVEIGVRPHEQPFAAYAERFLRR